MNRLFIATISLVMSSLVDGASASQAGWRQITVAGTGDSASIVVALYYPTQAPSQAIAVGPLTLHVAIQGPPEATVKGLILFSHGTGGSELTHSSLAEALARDGYLVAALRHAGDNWQDRSLLKDRSGAYFSERPRQMTRVIDALLIPSGARVSPETPQARGSAPSGIPPAAIRCWRWPAERLTRLASPATAAPSWQQIRSSAA
jgi:predicted dienelactone hydrolase